MEIINIVIVIAFGLVVAGVFGAIRGIIELGDYQDEDE